MYTGILRYGFIYHRTFEMTAANIREQARVLATVIETLTSTAATR